MSYSSLFQTRYDEPTSPYPFLTHYSILSFIQWLDPNGQLRSDNRAVLQNLAVIWDQDHDTRVIQVLERAHSHSLLPAVVAIAERRGHVRVVVSEDQLFQSDAQEYRKKWKQIVSEAITNDKWSLELIHARDAVSVGLIPDMLADDARIFLQNIVNVWGICAEFRSKEPFAW